MRTRVHLRHVVLLAALASITTPAAAQSTRLGPADGMGLPAVDTGRVRVHS